MSQSYFNQNQNLQIHGDVNFISNSESTHASDSFFHVSQQVQATSVQSRAVDQVRFCIDIHHEGLKIVCDNTAPSARYGYSHLFTDPQCYPGTRIAVQDFIFKWLEDVDGQIAMWMKGPVGIGKSAIAQTVADIAAERGQLSSAFFFFRSDNTRNSTERLISTMAYEMAQQIPRTLESLCQTVAANPLIFLSPLKRQINSAFLQHLRIQPSERSSEAIRLIVIDGLDECLDTVAQQAIIRLFISSLLSMSTQIIPHRLLIVSRPESHITSAFSASDIRPYVKHLSLDSWDTEDDIGTFLLAKLNEIKEAHPLRHHLPDIWPDDNSFRNLRRKSVGSFAYASAAMRFLASHNSNPKHVLRDLLSFKPLQATAAFADLDTLYRHIILSLDPEIRFIVQKVLCLYVYSSERNIVSLAACLSEEKSLVEVALIRVSSLIHLRNQSIKFHHSSFEEFLRDKSRSREFYVFSPTIASTVAIALSALWLQQGHHSGENIWFDAMGWNIKVSDINRDMNVEILTTLITTKLPASFSVRSKPTIVADSIVKFLHAIQWRSKMDSKSTDGPLYDQSFDVVCIWLRMKFNPFSQGVATLDNFIHFIRGQSNKRTQDDITRQENPEFVVFQHLAEFHGETFDFIVRLFPEMDCLDICFGILKKFLALPRNARISEMLADVFGEKITLHRLCVHALGRYETEVPSFCQRLEKIVSDGRSALGLGPVVGSDAKSKHYICYFLYGRIWNLNKGDPGALWEPSGIELVERIDTRIRQTHAQLYFEYISANVAALYLNHSAAKWTHGYQPASHGD